MSIDHMEKKTILALRAGSLFTSVDQLIAHHQKKYPHSYFYKPIGIEVEITNICNLRCRGCALIIDEVDKPKDVLLDTHFIHVLKECKRLGMFAYSLTGGEPFLKFKTITALLEADHGMDIYKLNTNGTYFKTPPLVHEYFSKLKKSGFAKNNYIKAVLVVSLGQQNLAGVPLQNAINAASLFYSYFPSSTATFTLNITEKNPQLSKKIYRDFQLLYLRQNGKKFDENLFQVRFFSLNYVPTLTRLNMLSGPKTSLEQRIQEFKTEYVSGGCFNIRIMNKTNPDQSETLVPRIVLRPNGDVYACPGYNRTHLIGNIAGGGIPEIIGTVNQNILFKTVFTKNLQGLYELALKNNVDTKNIRVERGYGPCDVCQVLTSVIQKKPIKWPSYASAPHVKQVAL